MTHRYLLPTAAAAAFAAAAPAMAQDVDWTGFYVGANLGASWGDTSLDTTVGPGSGPIILPPADVALINQTGSDDDNKTSFTGGVQAGYNYQTGSILLGVETDLGFFDLDQQRTNAYQSAVQPPIFPAPTPVTYAIDQRVKSEWIWTLRPRIGYVSGPWLFYATGGIATSKIKLQTVYADNRTPSNSARFESSDTDTGWTAGLGGAYAYTPNWSVRAEWLYVDFGKVKDTQSTPNGFATLTSEAKVKANLIRVGMDYKF